MCIQPTTFSFELFSAHFFTDGSHVASYYCVATPAIQCPYRPYAATFIQPRRRRWIHRIRFSFSLSHCVCVRVYGRSILRRVSMAILPLVQASKRNQRSPLSPITEEHRNKPEPHSVLLLCSTTLERLCPSPHPSIVETLRKSSFANI